jgi:hypothetical protein
MVKTGGCINADGAQNWLWYELQNLGADDDAGVRILWKGVAPPAGEPYLGSVDCNGCHVVAAPNDYVWSTPLQLRTLAPKATP